MINVVDLFAEDMLDLISCTELYVWVVRAVGGHSPEKVADMSALDPIFNYCVSTMGLTSGDSKLRSGFAV